MTTQVEATFANGGLTPDVPMALAEQTRVRLTIEPVEEWSAEKAREASEHFLVLAKEHPINSGGVRYTRDELPEHR